jgi:hypothetical protein
MFIKYGDGVEKLFTKAKQVLEVAQAENEIAQKAADVAKRELDAANEFVGRTYKSTRDSLNKQRQVIEDQSNPPIKSAVRQQSRDAFS